MLLVALGVPLVGAGCGEDDDGDGGTTTTVDWSSSSGTGGASTSGSGGSTVGSGGTTASGGAGGASSSSGAGGGGGSPSASLLLLGSGPTPYAAAYQAGSWNGADLSGATLDAPALAMLGSGEGVGLARGASMNALRFTRFIAGSWSAWADVGSSTRAAPAMMAAGASAHVVFHDPSFMHAYAAFDGSWAPTAEGLTPSMGAQSFGPTPPRMTMLMGEPLAAYAGSDEMLYTQARTGGSWQASDPVAGSKILDPPAIVALSTGPEMLVVYINHSPSPPPDAEDKKLYFATRTSGVWTTPQKISDQVFAVEPVNMVALPGGEAMLAFRGTDNKGYSLRYTPGATPWGAPTPIGNPNVDIASPPSVAVGAGGFVAELGYVAASDGSAHHVRHDATGWGAATQVGGTGLSHVAIASGP
jgi:hypothetical protein